MIYSNDKILYHSDRLRELKRTGGTVPIHVNFIISNACNHRCVFCAYRMEGYPTNQKFDLKTMMPKQDAIRLLNEMAEAGVRAIQFTGGGEPLVHPNFNAIYATAVDLGVDTSLVTNGQKLNLHTATTLMQSQWIRISLNAGTASTHHKIHRGSYRAFDETLYNIKNLVGMRQSAGSKLYIGIGFLVTKENYTEIIDAAVIARDLGVDSIRYSAVYSVEDRAYYQGIFANIKKTIHIAKELTTPEFEVIDSFGERIQDLEQGSPDYDKCLQQEISTFIGADLNVYRCCVTAYNTLGLLGSIKGVSFIDFWNNAVVREKLSMFNAKSCPRCQFNGKNKAIQASMDMLSNGHINFV